MSGDKDQLDELFSKTWKPTKGNVDWAFTLCQGVHLIPLCVLSSQAPCETGEAHFRDGKTEKQRSPLSKETGSYHSPPQMPTSGLDCIRLKSFWVYHISDTDPILERPFAASQGAHKQEDGIGNGAGTWTHQLDVRYECLNKNVNYWA